MKHPNLAKWPSVHLRTKWWWVRIPLLSLEGCIRYIFASLFCMSKREHLRNKEKCFLFHFESSSCLEIINFWHFRYSNIMTSSNAQAWNTKHILLNNLGSKRSLVMKFGQFMQYYKIIFLSKNSTKNVAWKLVPGPF